MAKEKREKAEIVETWIVGERREGEHCIKLKKGQTFAPFFLHSFRKTE